jgi:hypothetical protein
VAVGSLASPVCSSLGTLASASTACSDPARRKRCAYTAVSKSFKVLYVGTLSTFCGELPREYMCTGVSDVYMIVHEHSKTCTRELQSKEMQGLCHNMTSKLCPSMFFK